MHIQHIISMFEEKIAKNYEEMVVLKGNLPIKFSYKAIYLCLKT